MLPWKPTWARTPPLPRTAPHRTAPPDRSTRPIHLGNTMPSIPLPKNAPRFRKALVLLAAATAVPLALAGCVGTPQDPGAAGPIQVTSSPAVDAHLQNLLDTGTRQYSAFVLDQTDQLLDGTRAFAAAYAAGDTTKARGLYADTRMHWERIEPVAESFGDLDPKLDAREADLEPGQEWTGWHRIEKDLWPEEDPSY